MKNTGRTDIEQRKPGVNAITLSCLFYLTAAYLTTAYLTVAGAASLE